MNDEVPNGFVYKVPQPRPSDLLFIEMLREGVISLAQFRQRFGAFEPPTLSSEQQKRDKP